MAPGREILQALLQIQSVAGLEPEQLAPQDVYSLITDSLRIREGKSFSSQWKETNHKKQKTNVLYSKLVS